MPVGEKSEDENINSGDSYQKTHHKPPVDPSGAALA